MRPIHVFLVLSLAANLGAAAYILTGKRETPAKPLAPTTVEKSEPQMKEKNVARAETAPKKSVVPMPNPSAKKPVKSAPPASASKKQALAQAAAKIRSRYDFLSPEKVTGLQKIQRDYADLRKQAFVEAKNLGSGSADSNQFALLREEQRRDIEALLTPAELSEYDRRFSTTALLLDGVVNRMNTSLNTDEKRSIYELRRAVDEAFPIENFSAQNPPDKEYILYRTLAWEKVTSEIKAMLGDERYLDYDRAHSGDYRNVRAVAADNGLSIEVANNVYALRDAVSAESRRIHADRSMSFEQKKQAFADLAEQTRTQVKTGLGDQAGSAYLDKNMTWLRYVEQGASLTFKGLGDGVTFNTLRQPPAK